MESVNFKNKTTFEKVEVTIKSVRRIALYASVILINLGNYFAAKEGLSNSDHIFTIGFGKSMSDLGDIVDKSISIPGKIFDWVVLQKKKSPELSEKGGFKINHDNVVGVIQIMIVSAKFALKRGGYALLKISNESIKGVRGFRGLGKAGKVTTSLTVAQLSLAVYSSIKNSIFLIRDKIIPHFKELKELENNNAKTDADKARLIFLKNVRGPAIFADTFRQLLKSSALACSVTSFIMAVIIGMVSTAVTFSAIPFAMVAIAILIELAMHHLGVSSKFGLMEDLADYSTVIKLGVMSVSSPLAAAMFALVAVGIVFDAYQALKANPQAISDWYKVIRCSDLNRKQSLIAQIEQKKLARSIGLDVDQVKKQKRELGDHVFRVVYNLSESEVKIFAG